ncbi:uncharacterized protein PG998_009873 [Apiospora kogelbergensis]|uniref:uncharacterized protein n=1 Tax=Apiospora kogelbergensis TaxID=1337665 RepID=UPI00312D5DF0
MFLLLVRHGESTDNVANLYAGSRDAPLTNHGVLQAKRLADHLVFSPASKKFRRITHIFTSNLQRAYKTAEAVADAQAGSTSASAGAPYVADVVQLPELREKDFGSSEGKKFGTKSTAAAHEAAESDVEAPAAMMARVNRFIDVHLHPLFMCHASNDDTILVVAHGIILNYLFRALHTKFPAPATLTETHATWSNTGVLLAKIKAHKSHGGRDTQNEDLTLSQPSNPRNAPESLPPPPRKFSFLVGSINNVDHLKGLKKTRGGVGSAQFDPRQRSMDAFFKPTAKKRKAEAEAERD